MRPAGTLADGLDWVSQPLHAPFLAGDVEQMGKEDKLDTDGVGAKPQGPPLVAVAGNIDSTDRGEAAPGQGVFLEPGDEARLALAGFFCGVVSSK